MATTKNAVTIQSNIHNSDYSSSLTNYALFLGGTNVTHDALLQYDPLKTGYSRLFMVRNPIWVDEYFQENGSNAFKKFKHILEYGNTAVQGLGDITVNTNSIQGGYTGKSFEVPSVASDDTNQFSVQVYEFSGSPIREVLHTWINGTTDILTGLTHYNGLVNKDATEYSSKGTKLHANQSNQSAEFIYVVTDCTGLQVEYCCLFANCFPKGINLDAFNSTAGEHELVQTTIEFTCTKYESPQINAVGKALLEKYRILANSMNFNSGISSAEIRTNANIPGSYYEIETGKLKYETGPVSASTSQAELNKPKQADFWDTNPPASNT